ncbi:hypothetical protein T484DRAFT_1832741 [Baffinella frigidus]|nr:hypothetical protein T484DRAFT_1832741 [Cryptophyta sp. CCMP2293]
MARRTLTLLLALFAAPSAALLANPHSLRAPTALQLRGGLGLAAVAKIATGLDVAHSSFTVLPSDNDLEAFGLMRMNDQTKWILEGIGMQLLARAIGATMLRGCALPRGFAFSPVRHVGREGLYAGLCVVQVR